MEKSHRTAETSEQDRAALAKFMQAIDERNRAALAKFAQETAKQNQAALTEFAKGLSAQTDFSPLIESHARELQALSRQCIDKLMQDIEIERYRHMPWEQFLDLTFGSLADDPIELDQSFRTNAVKSNEVSA